MNTLLKFTIAITFVSFFITACSSTPEPKEDKRPSAQEQKANAKEAQRELSSETRKQ